ncbi:Lar family restriction alleviation protein [Megasphaera elsdenii]|uniref:Lar family restriction alleviation protein n=1 Tax=Megasphaera elsdenii TaxID=907 RepID=UPI00352233A4
MSILESVAQGLGVEINKQFQVYDQEGNHVAAAVFRLDRSGCQLLVTPKSEACIDPDTVLGGLISGNLVPKTRVLDHCPFCGGRNALVQRMRFTRGGQIQIMYTVYCPDCQAHGPLAESEDAAADGWNE